MELLVKPEMLTSYIYGPTFGKGETVSFYLLHNVSTLNQCREVSCVTFVCKHFASKLAFLALLGAPYIYDISSLRVNAAIVDCSYVFQLLQSNHHQAVYQKCKRKLLYI